MIRPRMFIAIAIAAALVEPRGRVRAANGSDWTQWGGPTRNFMVDSTGLASSWPSGGPKKLWTRPLGEGHSSILVEGNRLYTMYRPIGMLSMVRRRGFSSKYGMTRAGQPMA